MPTLKYDLVGDVSPLQDALKEAQKALKDTSTEGAKTEAATKKVATASDKAATSATGMARAQTAAAKSLDKTGDEANKASKSVDRFGTAAESAKQAAAGIGGPIGDVAGKIENFANAAKGAAVALGPVGLAITGLVVGAGAAVVAVVGIANAVIDLTREAKEAAVRLKNMRGALKVSDEEINSVNRANDALDLVSKTSDRLKVALADGASPAVERMAILSAAMGLALIDIVNYFGGFGKVLTEVTNLALSPFNSSVALLIEGGIALARLLGTPVPEAVLKMGEKFAASIKPVKDFESSITLTERSLATYVAQARAALNDDKLAEHLDKNTEAAKESAKADEDKGKTTDDLAVKTRALTKATADQTASAIAGASGLAGAVQASVAARLDAEMRLAEEKRRLDEEEAARRAEMLEKQRADAEAAVQSQIDMIANLIGSMNTAFSDFSNARIASIEQELTRRQEAVDQMVAQLTESEGTLSTAQEREIRKRLATEKAAIADLEKRRKRAAIAEFLASKTVRLGQIAIETARNVVSFAAPPPLGLGPVAGPIAATALGALSGAAVLAEPAPSFRTGGVVPSDAPRVGQSDQRMVIAEPGEVIVNPEQQRKAGSGAPPVVVLASFGDRDLVRLGSVVLQGPEAERAIRRASGMLGMTPAYGG